MQKYVYMSHFLNSFDVVCSGKFKASTWRMAWHVFFVDVDE